MSDALYDWWSKTYFGEPNHCDREVWNAALRYAASVVDTVREHESKLSVDTACDVIRQIILTEEVQSE